MDFVDTHTHLDFPEFDRDREALIKDLATQKIGVIAVCTDEPSISQVAALTAHPHIWGTVGLHPTEIDEQVLVRLPALLTAWASQVKASPKIVAIGEVGLDYYHQRDQGTIARQKAALRQFLTFAQEQKLPVIFHCREAYGDLLTMLADYSVQGVIHCFNGTAEQAEGFLKLGLYLSTTAMITYPKNEGLRQIFKALPSNKLLLETDCPFLPPQSRRGERNDPKTVLEIAELLADLRGTSREKIAEQTTANARQLFGLAGGDQQ